MMATQATTTIRDLTACTQLCAYQILTFNYYPVSFILITSTKLII